MNNKNLNNLYISTLAERLRIAMHKKNLNTIELAKLAGASRQAISYLLNNNVTKSKLTMKLATILDVSYKWLANGVEDEDFIEIKELPIFNNIFSLLQYLATKEKNYITKALTTNPALSSQSFVYNPPNTKLFYFCSNNKEIKSSKYLLFNLENNTYKIINSTDINHKTIYPIVEFKEIFI